MIFLFLFNSYYNNVGKRVLRPLRGLMTRPSVAEVYNYRKYVDAMVAFLKTNPSKNFSHYRNGINHEEQHQELLYDIKYILGNQPTFPSYEKIVSNQS
jgi:vacuolar-type H+-ATPase catalytic subunit A/Vma1